MRDLFREGLQLGESLARLPWKAARRLVKGRSETLERAADLGERLGSLPFRAAGGLVGGGEGRPGAPTGSPGPGRARSGPAGGPRPGSPRARIVVLGAGYAGLTCFLELQDHLPRSYDLVLVNADRYHWFTTELHTYVAGSTEDAVRVPLPRIVARPGRLIVDRVAAVHPERREVALEQGGPLSYDLLVFALGSEPEYFGLPGVEEHALIVGNWQGATRLRRRVQELLGGERPGERPQIVIAGGGLTGVEVAGELADQYPGRARLTILEAGPEIMAGFDRELVQVSRRVLEAKGIRILTGSPIIAVDERAVHLKGGEELSYDLLVWAGGVRGNGLLARAGLAVTPRGRGIVDPYLRSVTDDRLYLVGDSAAFTDPETGREVPPTAQAAVQMGHTAGRNILRRLQGRPEQPFTFRKKGAFASLGKDEGVGQIGEEHFAGLPAMMVKHLIEGHHAWEMGSGLLPLVRRLIRVPVGYLTTRRRGCRLTPTPRRAPDPKVR
ncbi:MAG: NAD(P)/FAD-dependent oxidoreductase [Bacillota bacterium]